jgi:NAD-dependent dihydropyrimidine dehydrogenase PreA subunit
MRINEECVGCRQCVPYCPMEAIGMDEEANLAIIDKDECVECGVCFRSKVCPVDAFEEEIHDWPRSIRAAFSNPLLVHKETRVPGRGTEEVKTNDVTGQFRRDFVGVTAEMGRPGVGARFYDVEKVARALARAGVTFAANNPVTYLMKDQTTGELNKEIINEKVCSAMIESTTPLENLESVMKELREVTPQIETVFSLTLSERLEHNGSSPCEKILKKVEIPICINGKTNVGLGRPLFEED